MKTKNKNKKKYTVAAAVRAVIRSPKTAWGMSTGLVDLAGVVYGYHVSGKNNTAARTTWARYEREARRLLKAGLAGGAR